tara:strand:- start:1290 stop:1499 length:210 start_codon:yes stop_codon:yes gene_type:complete
MQGKKHYQEKMFTSFQLSDYVLKTNFYRRLKAVLDLDFIYDRTKVYNGDCGQKSRFRISFKVKGLLIGP